MIFLTTLYLQQTLGLSPLATGLVFGIPGVASVAAGVVAGRIIGRFGCRTVLTASMAVQGLATLPLVFLGTDRVLALVVLIPALFIGFYGHVAAIVAYTVTATADVPDDEQGLASGLASMTQEVGATVGTPVLAAIAATQATHLAGTHLALSVNVALTLACVVLVWFGLRPAPVPARELATI
jgi:predicted MFS family arabinose efflux permease